MRSVFVDANYLVASFQKKDQWHVAAEKAELGIKGSRLVTTDSVLCELLNYFSGYSEQTRREITGIVRDILADEEFAVIEQTRSTFLQGIELYENRLDKGYSLTDCISMNVCREHGIEEILTHDKHFEQEGFKILL